VKAVGLYRYLPIDHPESLLDLEIAPPVPEARDLLVEIRAVSVNPVDAKQRAPKSQVETAPRILGWDAAGVVRAVGSQVTRFRPGEEVYYAGSVVRPGSNSELHCVDERIVGRKPAALTFAEAAALPLTTLTAWELFFDRMGISKSGGDAGRSLLILGGAGGVGSIGIQLAKQLARLNVIASASRAESIGWAKSFGADATVDHTQPLPAQLEALGAREVDFVACFSDTDRYFPEFPRLLKAQGRIGAIVRSVRPVDLSILQPKSIAFCWEGMFTRSTFQTPDMGAQGDLLREAAAFVEAGVLRTTVGDNLGRICADNLKRAHARLEQGHVVGKLVLEGF
jgi:NADPH2:quinone reductase